MNPNIKKKLYAYLTQRLKTKAKKLAKAMTKQREQKKLMFYCAQKSNGFNSNDILILSPRDPTRAPKQRRCERSTQGEKIEQRWARRKRTSK